MDLRNCFSPDTANVTCRITSEMRGNSSAQFRMFVAAEVFRLGRLFYATPGTLLE